MTTKTTSIIAYLSIVGWLIAYLAGDKEGARFHLNQSLVILAANMFVGLISVMGGLVLFRYITPIINLALAVVWLVAFIDACKGKETPLPILKDIQILK